MNKKSDYSPARLREIKIEAATEILELQNNKGLKAPGPMTRKANQELYLNSKNIIRIATILEMIHERKERKSLAADKNARDPLVPDAE